MNRREFVKVSALAAAAAALPREMAAAAAEAASQPGVGKRPNILFILSDDHSAPHLGCYGDPNIKTPNLDRLASEGMLFGRNYVTAPQCVPSRASLMTGRSPVACRITRFSAPLPRDEITLPELLRKQAGYFTGICGRTYHLDGSGRPEVSERIFDKHNLRTFQDRVDYLDDGTGLENVERLNEFLDKVPAGKPWFLWANYIDPHRKWDENIPAPDPAGLKLPGYLPDLPEVRQELSQYYAEIMRLDADFGRLMAALEKRGQADNTIIVFMGDNGYAFPHGKGSLHDPGIHTPLIVRWTGVVKPDSRSQALISGEDLAPTLLEAAGLKAPERMSGVSFAKLLRGRPFEGRKYIFAERGVHGQATMGPQLTANGMDFSRCVRSDRYKLIYNCTPWMHYAPVDSIREPAWRRMVTAHNEGELDAAIDKAYFTHPRPFYELYDLQKDPNELDNLAGKPELADMEWELKEALQEKMIVDFDYLPLPINTDRKPAKE
jgi:arylsulfatase A-like enzyme